MKEILLFIQNQILGMKFLNSIIGNLLEKLGIDISSKFGGALHFFMYDVIKIFILLFTMITSIPNKKSTSYIYNIIYTKLFSAGKKQAGIRKI